MRKNWLSAVMVIAYKYKYGGQHDEASAIVGEKVWVFLLWIMHPTALLDALSKRDGIFLKKNILIFVQN